MRASFFLNFFFGGHISKCAHIRWCDSHNIPVRVLCSEASEGLLGSLPHSDRFIYSTIEETPIGFHSFLLNDRSWGRFDRALFTQFHINYQLNFYFQHRKTHTKTTVHSHSNKASATVPDGQPFQQDS